MPDQSDKRAPVATAQRAPSPPGPDDRTVIRQAGDGEESTPSRPQYLPPYMVVVDGPRAGARFPLAEGQNIIGRAQGSAIRLEDQSVSRQHAEISKGPSGWVVKDLGSKNGTLVNAKLIAEPVVIGHKDVVKTGIYQLRLITEPTGAEEEMALPPEVAAADRTVFVEAPPDSLTADMEKGGASLDELPPELPEGAEAISAGPSEGKAAKKPGRMRRAILFGALGISAIIAIAYFASDMLFTPAVEGPTVAGPLPEGGGPEGAVGPPTPPVPLPPGPAGGEGPPILPPDAEQLPPAAAQQIPVFLDIASSPLPAKVTFQGNDLGQTPLKANVQIEPGRQYQAEGLFEMPEIQQQFQQGLSFTAEPGQSVVPLFFRAPIGTIRITELPRDVQFYLEGRFEYEKFQAQTAKLQQIVLQKPIYVPFGSYSLELKRTRQLGESSQTFVADIVFKREFAIAAESPSYTLEVKEEDLRQFPAKIRSDPPGAELFIDGAARGKTPFEGMLPLGEHRLTLRKEGYFEHSEVLKVDINTPFLAEVKLKTSVAGAHINNARLAMNRAMYQEAINELAEALSSQPAPSEVALAHHLLGLGYLKLNDIQRAIAYFTQAREGEGVKYQAMLGLATANAMMQRIDLALPLLVEVLLKAEDEETKKDAHDLFQKISPFRSVIYVYSEPPGAKVVVNDKAVEQPTPVILHELPLGNYRLRIEKPGFLPTDLNLSLSVNEFNPVIVKLKPIPQ